MRRYDEHGQQIAPHLPSPAEVWAAAARIRRGWTARETVIRAGLDPDERLTVPEVSRLAHPDVERDE